MAKFQPSKYYADDKDIHDILSSAKISTKRLLSLCRERGIFISEESTREELVHYMSKLPFSWLQMQQVMAEVAREDREEKITACKIETSAPLEQMEQAIQKVKDARGEALAENYTVTETKEGKLQVKVSYTEPDFQKARLIQRREREATIEIEKSGTHFQVRHTQNDKTNTIVSEILAQLTPDNADAKPVKRSIELSGIRNHAHRTQFFINLMGGMEGYQLREVKDLKVDRMADEVPTPEEAEDPETDKNALKAIVRKVALSGENILISPQYQQLAKDGFFISKAIWTSAETAGKGRLFEFEAEFKDAEKATNFAYQIRGVYDRDKDGELTKVRRELSEDEKSGVKTQLEGAAYESVEKVSLLNEQRTQ